MVKNCSSCQKDFEITENDLGFYQKIHVPAPKDCPKCRLKRRLAFRNEKNLYKRNCDLCHKSFISSYQENVPYKVYCQTCFWSDNWDPLEYGQDFDFNRSFFDQFKELMQKVPKAGVLNLNNENSEYNQFLAFSKNTYMSHGSYLLENCYYVRKSQNCNDCVSSNALNKCQLIAESTNCDNCYNCHHLINCRNCSFASYLIDCTGIKNSFMCAGLISQEYCFKNKKYTKEEYEKILQSYQNKDLREVWQEFISFVKEIGRKKPIQLNCENSTGQYLTNCKNALECYDCFYIEDSKYLLECREIKDSMDLTMHDKEIELCYELCCAGEKNYNTKFCFCTVASPNSEYLYSCFYLSDSFGCDGFHSKQNHCILNKKYTKEQYETLKQRIIEHMYKTGEYGSFFPLELSTYPYSETAAEEYFPIHLKNKTLPATDPDLPVCQICQKNYRLLKQETELHEKIGLKLQNECSKCRQTRLMNSKLVAMD